MVSYILRAQSLRRALSMLTYYFISVDDEVVIEIVKKHVLECEAKGKSWIVQGFPRTKAQALAL